MHVQAIELRQLEIPLIEPMAAAYGVIDGRVTTLVHVLTDVGDGWGECIALNEPTYLPEWANGEYEVLREVFGPSLLTFGEIEVEDLDVRMDVFKGHNPAKGALEMALLDVDLRAAGESLAERWGVTQTSVRCTGVVGITDLDSLERSVARQVERGYRAVKLKIAPGRDLDRIDLVRRSFPDLSLSVDANGSYVWDDPEHRRLLHAIDERGLTCIEQPAALGRALPLVEIRQALQTPVALDDWVVSWDRAMNVIDFGMADIVGVKPGLIGGYLVGKRLHDECLRRSVSIALGGMVETGLARAANLALAALPGFQGMPAEIAPDGRWFYDRINTEPVLLEDGYMKVPTGIGFGIELDFDVIDRLTRRVHVLHGR